MSKERAAQLVDAGIWLKLSGDREGARKLFERALKLDPENTKAAQLLAGGTEELPPAPPGAAGFVIAPSIAPLIPSSSPSRPGGNPFEVPAASPPSANEREWTLATQKPPPPAIEPTLEADWGRLTGASTPVPQHAPSTSTGNTPAPRTVSTPSSPGMNVVIGLTPIPTPIPMTQQRQTLSDWGTQVGSLDPQSVNLEPSDSPPTISPVNSSPSRSTIHEKWTGSSPTPAPVKRSTLSDWGTQISTTSSSPSPPPIAPVAPGEIPVSSGSGARSTMHEKWTSEPPPSIAPVSPAGMPVSSGSGARSTMHEKWTNEPSSESSPMVVHIGGDPGPETPPPSTPPLFGGAVPEAIPSPPPQRVVEEELSFATHAPLDVPVHVETPRTFTEPMGFAWGWSSSSTPPPEPRPSPSLSPRAESAWDARSNPGITLEAVVGRDKALDLISSDSKVTRAAPSKKDEIDAILRGARDLLGLDDHTGAMELIRKAEAFAPDDPEVISMRDRSEKTLLTMFESKLGKIEAIPRVLLKDDEIIWLNLDHRAGFVLAQIDGTVSFDDLFSVSGMTRIDTARILAQLVEEGVISRG